MGGGGGSSVPSLPILSHVHCIPFLDLVRHQITVNFLFAVSPLSISQT